MCNRLTIKVTKFQQSTTNRFSTVAKHCLGVCVCVCVGGGQNLPSPIQNKVKAVSESETEHCRQFIGIGFCSHQECYFWNNFCSRAGLHCSIFKRCTTCNATEHSFLFTMYRISFFLSLYDQNTLKLILTPRYTVFSNCCLERG